MPARRVLIGTVLGGALGFWVAEQLAVGYRVRHLVRRATAVRAARVSSGGGDARALNF